MVSMDQFFERLAASGLSIADEVRKMRASFSDASRPTSGDELARVLVERKVLNEFQAQAVLDPHGQRLGLGQYVILDKIGEGGMGSVFKALHRHLRREVALKVLHADLKPLVGTRRTCSRWWKRGAVAAATVLAVVASVLLMRQNPREEAIVNVPSKIEPPVAPRVAPARAIAPFDGTQAQSHQAAWAKYLDLPLGVKNDIGMTLLLIPPGEFQQGASDQEVEEFSKLEADNASIGFRIVLTTPPAAE